MKPQNDQDTLTVQIMPSVNRRDVLNVYVLETGIQVASFSHVLRYGYFPNHWLRNCALVTYPISETGKDAHLEQLSPSFFTLKTAKE